MFGTSIVLLLIVLQWTWVAWIKFKYYRFASHAWLELRRGLFRQRALAWQHARNTSRPDAGWLASASGLSLALATLACGTLPGLYGERAYLAMAGLALAGLVLALYATALKRRIVSGPCALSPTARATGGE
jgi:hypothetical protein